LEDSPEVKRVKSRSICNYKSAEESVMTKL